MKGHFLNVYNKNWVRSFRRETLILHTSIFKIKFGTELPKVPHITNYLNIKTSSLINIRKSGRISLKRIGKRTENSKNLLFPICVNEEYKLGNSPKQLEICFRNSLIWNRGPYLLTRLWVRFSHLNEHKFCHNLGMLLNFKYDCGYWTETINNWGCAFFTEERQKLPNIVFEIRLSFRNYINDLICMRHLGIETFIWFCQI